MKLSLFTLLFLAVLFLESGKYNKAKEKYFEKTMNKSFAYVPSGDAFVEQKKISIQAFYISKTEITNKDYLEFLNDLKSKGELEKWKIAQIDSSKWNMKNSMNESYTKYYHNHPAYENYPVVNISHEAAILYCNWLSEKYNELLGTKEFVFRLPKKEEFVRAGRGDSELFNYSWGSNSVRNKEGQIQCNFLRFGSESIHENEESGKYEIIPVFETILHGGYDVLAPAKSYWPNQFGIYNLNGNAAEMIDEKGFALGGSWKNTGYDVRLESQSLYEQSNPMTGFRVVMTPLSQKK